MECASAAEHNYSSLSKREQRVQFYETFITVCSNQLKINIYKHNVFSPNSIAQNPYFSHKAISCASDTIRVCSNLQKTSPMYKLQAVHYNFFVLSAVAVLYLAVRNAPMRFNNASWDILMGLEVLKTCCSSGMASQRIYEKVQALENAMTGLGCNSMQISRGITFQQENNQKTLLPAQNNIFDEIEEYHNLIDFDPETALFPDFLSQNLVTEAYDLDFMDITTGSQQLVGS